MAKKKFDAAIVEAIRAGSHEASGWLKGEAPSIDEMTFDVAMAAIEAARQEQRGALLDATRRDARDKKVRKAAGAALHKLKAAGVAVEDAPRRQWSTSGDLDAPPPPVALLGMPDPNGYMPFMMVAYGREEAYAAAGLAGAGQGYTDADHASLSRSAAREVLQNSREQQALQEVPFHVGLHFVQRAFDEGTQGIPQGFGYLLDSVPTGLQNSAKILDPLEGQATTLDRDALHATEPLMDPREGVYFALDEDIMYGSLNDLMQALGSALELDEETRARRISQIVDDAADAALNETARRSWTLAMDVVTFLAFRESKRALQSVARHTALALRDPEMAGHAIPFVRQWVDMQMRSVISMAMANQNAMGPDEGLGEEDGEAGEAGEAGEDSGIILTDG
ncbi:MAG: hypothetical protein AAFV53_24480 [Myxococcota bacterium]